MALTCRVEEPSTASEADNASSLFGYSSMVRFGLVF
jgi:hypothetical protein